MTKAEAHDWALRYVRRKLEHGATRESMNSTTYEGHGCPGKPGYELSQGKITVPCLDSRGHTFRIDRLVDEIESPQRGLWGDL